LVAMRIPAIVLAYAQLGATDAFVQPLFSAPFLSTDFAPSNSQKASFPKIPFGKKAANKLFSTTQEVETGEPSPAPVNPAKTCIDGDTVWVRAARSCLPSIFGSTLNWHFDNPVTTPYSSALLSTSLFRHK